MSDDLSSVPDVNPPPESRSAMGNTTIFLVHGHDNAAKYTVARFLEQSLPRGGSVTILDEQPNSGRTLIEKFEEVAKSSGYAIVLLTPDDVGGPACTGEMQARARQNVIFEMGYFAGKLGRGRVSVINAGVEKPSDVSGIVYISYPDGNWQSQLIRELRAAGFDAMVP